MLKCILHLSYLNSSFWTIHSYERVNSFAFFKGDFVRSKSNAPFKQVELEGEQGE